MNRDELLDKLRQCHAIGLGDPEAAHARADAALLAFIADDEVSLTFELIEKWYA